MKDKYFDYTKEPGKTLENLKTYKQDEPVISIIIPFYNDKEYINQSVNSILNQTFPLFEILIIDDGSTDEESIDLLNNIEKIDNRIKVFHKKNEGLAQTRDYGASKASKSTKYLVFCDSDDLLDKTFIECAYWTLETNLEASWAYSDTVGFGHIEYLWNSWFDSKKLKKFNNLVATAMIRKEAFNEVNGYELKEKAVNEDWNFWLKLISKGRFPVRMSYYGIWYRRKKEGELTKSRQNKERALEIIKKTSATIKKKVEAIQYPKQDYDWDGIVQDVKTIKIPQYNANNKINILMIIPWMITGGADKFNLDLVSGLDKEKFDITILTTEPNIHNLRQKFETFATVYDLTSFIDKKYWISFIKYIIETNNINLIFNTNSKFGYSSLPYLKEEYPNIPIVDYIHMEEWYNRNGGYSRDSSMVASVIDKTLVCNKNSENILKDYFKRNQEELETVYIGVDEKEFNPTLYNKEELLKKYKINAEGKYIISYICRIAEQKRPYLLLEIIKELKNTRKDFLVLVAGDGNLLNDIKLTAQEFKITDNIKFLGNVTKTKEIYAISDLTINCSIKEGVALTSYESLAMGIPVISSNVGGQKELINSDVGVIVPCLQKEKDIHKFEYTKEEIQNYVNAINKVLNNLQNYKSKCRKRILDGFTINHMINRMSAIFEEIYVEPNKQKISNGQAMKNSNEILKELINLNFMANDSEYKYLCNEYNKNFFEPNISKWSRIKNTLWKIRNMENVY